MGGVLLNILLFLLTGALLLRFFAGFGLFPKLSSSLFSPSGKRFGSRRFTLSPTGKIFLLALGIRAAVLLAAVAIVLIRSDTKLSLEDCFQSLQQWDARHYINLIDKGYRAYTENDQHLFLVFFPGYVWLVRLLRLIIPNTIAAGMALSSLCFAGGCCYLYKLAVLFCTEDTAKEAVLYLSFFPFSFFSGMVMTEGLFLLTVTAACYYACKRKWIIFGIWGILSALTRMTGILVIAVAFLELLESCRGEDAAPSKLIRRILARLPLILLPLLGTGIYLILNYVIDGDPFAFLVHQQHWSQSFLWVSNVMGYVWPRLIDGFSVSIGWSIWLPTLVIFIACLLLLFLAIRKKELPTSLLVYAFCYLLVNYCLSWLLSAGRYLSCGFVFFLILAVITEKRPMLRSFLQGSEAVFLGVYLMAYVSGAQVM